MKKLLIIFLLFLTINIFSYNFNFWDKEKEVINVENIIGYNPGISIYHYNNSSVLNYYYFDSFFYNFNLNVPIYQCGFTIYYRWVWGLETFVLNTLFRVIGFNIDIFNLTLKISLMDVGFSWYKYNWWEKFNINNTKFCFLFSLISVGFDYRIRIDNITSFIFHSSYSMQMIYNNNIQFRNDETAILFMEHIFNIGFGFRFNLTKEK
jgi:hypothetical protein